MGDDVFTIGVFLFVMVMIISLSYIISDDDRIDNVNRFVDIYDTNVISSIDDHGCTVGAGYSYNDTVGACIREWELNSSQRDVAMNLINILNIENATIINVTANSDVTTVYDIFVDTGYDIEKYYLDKDPSKRQEQEDIFGCKIGFSFCPNYNECINSSTQACGGENITVEECVSAMGNVKIECDVTENAVSNVGDLLCCFKNGFVVMSSIEVCNNVCTIYGFERGVCSDSCDKCYIAGQCSDSSMCTCL